MCKITLILLYSWLIDGKKLLELAFRMVRKKEDGFALFKKKKKIFIILGSLHTSKKIPQENFFYYFIVPRDEQDMGHDGHGLFFGFRILVLGFFQVEFYPNFRDFRASELFLRTNFWISNFLWMNFWALEFFQVEFSSIVLRFSGSWIFFFFFFFCRIFGFSNKFIDPKIPTKNSHKQIFGVRNSQKKKFLEPKFPQKISRVKFP